jgi:hypothetical protein
MSAASMELFTSALGRQSPAVITFGDGPARREAMIQFDSEHGKKTSGFWAAVHEGDLDTLDYLIDSRQQISVWFQVDATMIRFDTKLLKKRRVSFSTRRMLLIAWPTEVLIVEERQQPRRWVPDTFKISAKIQILTPHRQVAHEAEVRIWDIGLEGASLICPAEPSLLALAREEWLKLIVRVGDDARDLPFLASYRHMTRVSHEKVRMGVKFIPSGDPNAPAANEALKNLVHHLSQSSTTPTKSAA